MSTVPNKRTMYDMLLRGMFGNASPRFSNYHDFETFCKLEAMRTGEFPKTAIRVMKPGGRCDFDVPFEAVIPRVESLLRLGYRLNEIIFDIMMPDCDLVLQGYARYASIWELPNSTFILEYSTTPCQNMREGMKYPMRKFGLSALLHLRAIMDENSYNDMQEMFDDYPDAVIEFTVYKYDVGNCPRRNTIFWECRNY